MASVGAGYLGVPMKTATQDTMRRLAAIRRIANQYPLENAAERLDTIVVIASGDGDVRDYLRAEVHTAPPEEKKRKTRGGRDRMETGGTDRKE